MDYRSEVMLLCVVAFNIAVIVITILLNTGYLKCSRKTLTIVTLIVLSLSTLLNLVFMVCFVVGGLFDNLKVYVLFLPLTCWLLFDAIKEARRK